MSWFDIAGRVSSVDGQQSTFDEPSPFPGNGWRADRFSLAPRGTGDAIALARTLAATENEDDRLALARAATHRAVDAYWEATHSDDANKPSLLSPPCHLGFVSLSESLETVSRHIGAVAARTDVARAGFLIGGLYTALMPEPDRTRLGAYYTPPALCDRLIELATEVGIDWRHARVLDPACGGGAFLAPAARRMAQSLIGDDPSAALDSIVERLRGFELDPFAAWMSRVFLDVALADLCKATGRRLPDTLVDVCDSLDSECAETGFDLVIGNPPYGRVALSPELRTKYGRSLYGHANLYGVFTDLALRLTRPGGIIAFVTPTGFLGGEYFKALRGLLGREAPPAGIDFITERKGVFAGVLQEALLAAYRRGRQPSVGRVSFISPSHDGAIKVVPAGSFELPSSPDRPWIVPRTASDSAIVRGAERMNHRLSDYGYKVSTGPLVWNRHKPSLRSGPGPDRYPLIWAEAVRPNGTFEFRAEKRNHQPYFEPRPNERWVVTRLPCVLVQRTTAKEQSRRLIAAELPLSFIQDHGAVVVENHLNMIRPASDSPRVSPKMVAALLNTRTLDRLFRCISGSVAVSAYELEAMPLPSPESLAAIQPLIQSGAERSAIDEAVHRLYVDVSH